MSLDFTEEQNQHTVRNWKDHRQDTKVKVISFSTREQQSHKVMKVRF